MSWQDSIDWSPIPDHLRHGLKHYVDEGRIPGNLLVGILSNELNTTVEACEAKWFAEVPAILAFIHLHVPPQCYGSGERMAFWEQVGGLKGLSEIAHFGTRGDKFP
jgi:hypothetical protein